MPIYEFFCKDCNTIFSFFSKTINTTKIPTCPKCKQNSLSKQMSTFAFTGKAKEQGADDDLPISEDQMQKAMNILEKEAGNMKEDDPVAAAKLMRRLSDVSGLQLGNNMEEALSRMEKGEDPETVEAEMGDLLEGEEPFVLAGKKSSLMKKFQQPIKDETLYDL